MTKLLTYSIILVLTLTTISSSYLYISERNSADTCSEKNYTDSNIGISFNYPCEWEFTTSIVLSDEIIQNENSTGPLLEDLELILRDGSDQIRFDFFTNSASRATALSLNEFDQYSVLSKDVARAKNSKDSEWTYYSYVECDKLPVGVGLGGDDCAKLFFEEIDSRFNFQIKVQSEDIKQIDDVIENL